MVKKYIMHNTMNLDNKINEIRDVTFKDN